VGQGNGFKNKWIKKDGDAIVLIQTEEPKDENRDLLKGIQKTQSHDDPKLLAQLKKKKLVTVTKVITYTVTKGPKYAKEIPVEHTDLTVDLLTNDAWKTANFKPYNFAALGANQDAGALHPLNKVRQEFRNIFFSQGFVEMPTGQYVLNIWLYARAANIPQLRRHWLLELRRPLRTTATSRPRHARYLLRLISTQSRQAAVGPCE
jgi:phenylalanyl-tRNA synthetase alpha chain